MKKRRMGRLSLATETLRALDPQGGQVAIDGPTVDDTVPPNCILLTDNFSACHNCSNGMVLCAAQIAEPRLR